MSLHAACQKGVSKLFFEPYFFRVIHEVAKCPVILRYFSAFVSPIFLSKSTTKNRHSAFAAFVSLFGSLHPTDDPTVAHGCPFWSRLRLLAGRFQLSGVYEDSWIVPQTLLCLESTCNAKTPKRHGRTDGHIYWLRARP